MTYLTKYPHIAPEVEHGDYKQSTFSDMFSLGQLLIKISSLSGASKRQLLSLINAELFNFRIALRHNSVWK